MLTITFYHVRNNYTPFLVVPLQGNNCIQTLPTPTNGVHTMPSKHKQKIRKAVLDQYDHTGRRFGETPIYTKPTPNIYKEPVKHCIALFRKGLPLYEAVYLTRLTFTDPSQPHYVPIERWNSELFHRSLIRYLKAH